MGSWIKERVQAAAGRIWDEGALLDDEIERAIRETVEEAAKRAELGSCTPHTMRGECDHQDCAAHRTAAALVRAMLRDPADADEEVPRG